jgi:hypothetical protein
MSNTVVDLIHKQGHGHFQSRAALGRHFLAFRERGGLFHVASRRTFRLRPPAVGRVGFANVNPNELGLILVALP